MKSPEPPQDPVAVARFAGPLPLVPRVGPSRCSPQDGQVPTPPRRPWTHDASPSEIETRAELDYHLAAKSLRGLTVLGLDLRADPPDLAAAEVVDAMFVGCRFAGPTAAADVVA